MFPPMSVELLIQAIHCRHSSSEGWKCPCLFSVLSITSPPLSDSSPIIALPCQSVSSFVELFSNCWICQNWYLHGFLLSCYVDLSKLIQRCLQVVTGICQNWYKDLSKLVFGFVKVVIWICQSCYMIFSPFAKKNMLKFDPDFKNCWSFCFQIKWMNSMPWGCWAFGNVFTFGRITKKMDKSLSPSASSSGSFYIRVEFRQVSSD